MPFLETVTLLAHSHSKRMHIYPYTLVERPQRPSPKKNQEPTLSHSKLKRLSNLPRLPHPSHRIHHLTPTHGHHDPARVLTARHHHAELVALRRDKVPALLVAEANDLRADNVADAETELDARLVLFGRAHVFAPDLRGERRGERRGRRGEREDRAGSAAGREAGYAAEDVGGESGEEGGGGGGGLRGGGGAGPGDGEEGGLFGGGAGFGQGAWRRGGEDGAADGGVDL